MALAMAHPLLNSRKFVFCLFAVFALIPLGLMGGVLYTPDNLLSNLAILVVTTSVLTIVILPVLLFFPRVKVEAPLVVLLGGLWLAVGAEAIQLKYHDDFGWCLSDSQGSVCTIISVISGIGFADGMICFIYLGCLLSYYKMKEVLQFFHDIRKALLLSIFLISLTIGGLAISVSNTQIHSIYPLALLAIATSLTTLVVLVFLIVSSMLGGRLSPQSVFRLRCVPISLLWVSWICICAYAIIVKPPQCGLHDGHVGAFCHKLDAIAALAAINCFMVSGYGLAILHEKSVSVDVQLQNRDEEIQISPTPNKRRSCSTSSHLFELPKGNAAFRMVEMKFQQSWKRGVCPRVTRVFKVQVAGDFAESYDAYLENHGNACFCYHGTRRECLIGENGRTTLCSSSTCKVCSIIKNSFDVIHSSISTAFGRAIYTSTASNKAASYSDGVLFVAKAVLGNVYTASAFAQVRGCPSGYDSVVFDRMNGALNETVVYRNEAIKPIYLIAYSQ